MVFIPKIICLHRPCVFVKLFQRIMMNQRYSLLFGFRRRVSLKHGNVILRDFYDIGVGIPNGDTGNGSDGLFPVNTQDA